MGSSLRTDASRVYRVAVPTNDRVVETIFYIPREVGDVPQPRGVAVVVGEQELGLSLAGEPVIANVRADRMEQPPDAVGRPRGGRLRFGSDGLVHRTYLRSSIVMSPCPGVA